MNNKGFMMAEVIVVSAIILTFMTGLYLSYNKLFSSYNTRIDYYDSETIFSLAYYRDLLIKDGNMANALSRAKSYKFNDLSRYKIVKKGDQAILLYSGKQRIDRKNITATISPSFSDYVEYVSTSIIPKSNYLLVMERCDGDDCIYGYLEVYDGKET